MAQLVSRHSCVADRLPVVRFPAGPRVRLKTVDPPKGNGLGQKKKLLATLLHPWVAEFAASILSLEDAKCEIASVQHLRAAYVQTVEQFAQRASETGEQSFAMETF